MAFDMHTKLLMTLSAAYLLALGLLLTFAPQETLAFAHSTASPILTLIVQATGALYVGFAVLNYMAKDNIIGGIYSRPVGLGNSAHFFIAAMAILKAVASGTRPPLLVAIGCLYALFAIWFIRVTFGNLPTQHPK
jgi:hypothetical protein